MALRNVFVVRYATHYDEYQDFHEVEFYEIREAVRFTRDHAYVLRSTEMVRMVKGHEGGFKLTDL